MALLYNINYNDPAIAKLRPSTDSQSQGVNNYNNQQPNSIWEQGKQYVAANKKSILKKALQLLAKLFISDTAAAGNKSAELGATATDKATKQVQSLADIENMINELSGAIGDESKMIQKLLDGIQGELTEKVEAQKQEIATKLEEIKAQQQILADPSQSVKNKLSALNKIEKLSSNIHKIIRKSADIQKAIADNLETIKTSQSTIEELTSISEEQVQAYADQVAQTAAEAAEGTIESAATGAEAAINTTQASVCTAGAAAAGTGAVVTFGATAGAATKLGAEAADQGGAAAINTATSTTAGASFVATIGSLTNNTSILEAFRTYIGTETGTLQGLLGEANTALEPLITSVGSMATEGVLSADLGKLATSVNTDRTTLSQLKTQKATGSQKSLQQGSKIGTEVELETPKFEFTFGL